MKKIIFTITATLLLSFYGKAQPATGLNYDGADDYVSCGDILPPSYTKEAWVNLTSLAFFNNIISNGGSGGEHAFWAPASFGSRLSAGHNLTWDYVQDPTPLVAGTWYHVAVTYDAATTTMKLYKNGVLVSSNTAVPAFNNGNGVSLGAYGGAAVFIGTMDEVRIWNRALCQDEIQNNMNCGLNPSGQNGLVALYHFDQGTVNANNAGITTLTDASGNGNNGTLNNFALTGTTSNWSVGTVSGTCSAFAPTVMAGTPGGGTVSSTMTVSSSATYFTSNCELINRVVPSGATPVSGSVTSKVTIDATVQSYNGSQYVQRHYDIEPVTNPSTADATITLYYTQAEFDNYNTARVIPPFLPAFPADVVGIGNLRITQYHGTGTAPGNYSGLSELINPADPNIVWNATLSRWEVTFDVTGFSGFFAHTTIGGVLPVNLVSFSGISNGAYNKMQWVTSSEQNSDYFDLERSIDGITFSKTTTLQAQNNSSNNYYSYNDLRGTSNIYYYRLKMVEKDGAFKYSAIIRINSKQNNIISVYPNPAKETITISVSDTKLFKTDIKLTDMNGRLVKTVNLSNLQQPVDIARLQPGTYIIQFADGSFTKFVKQ
jgi:hypothetical protein